MLFAAAHQVANGTKRAYRDDLLFVRFRGEADVHGYVASRGWVEIDPQRRGPGRNSAVQQSQLHKGVSLGG
jgi:hypothetical protein